MKCTSCGSNKLQPIKVFAGHNMAGWSPVSGEKDIFGNYKKLRPLLAHACEDCGNVSWNIRLDKPQDPDKTAAALDELNEEAAALAETESADPGEQSTAYSFESLDKELG